MKKREWSEKIMVNIIVSILYISIGTFAFGLIFGIIGKLAKYSLLITLAGYSIMIFIITVFIMCLILLFLIAVHYYVLIKIIGVKQFILRIIKVYIPVLVILLVISTIRNKEPEWVKSVIYSFFITSIFTFKILKRLFNGNGDT
jgi:hypothetical protein